jgi:protein SCO1/2
MKRIADLPCALALAATLLLSGCGGGALHGGELEPARAAPEVALIDYTGAPFSLARQRDSVVLMFFGYTSCPDVCPATLSKMTQVKRQLGLAFDKVRVVFITVDPYRDTPEKLAAYLPMFDGSFLGLTGTAPQLRGVMNAYQITAVRREAADAEHYSIDHTAFTFVIDKQGRLRELLTSGAPVSDIVNDVRALLRE